MEMNNKVAVVTGGASGIGAEIVKTFLEKGLKNVAILDINVEAGRKFVDELNAKYGKGRVIFIITDVTNDNNFEDAFKVTKDTFSRIDIVVNNAGIANEDNYALAIGVNLTAVVRGTLLASKYMSKNNGGSGGVIVNIASIAGLEVFYPYPVYSATKAGVIAFVRSFGQPFNCEENGVSVIALCPGFTSATALDFVSDHKRRAETDKIIKVEKVQKVDIVARAVVYVIAHGESGEIWIIEGGDIFKTDIPGRHSYSKLVLKNI